MKEKIKQSQDAAGQAMEMARQTLGLVKEMDLTSKQKEDVMKMIDEAQKAESIGNKSKALLIYNRLLKKLNIIKSRRERGEKGKDALIFKTIEELEALYSPEEIAHNQDEVSQDTKVYIGELYPRVFNDLTKEVEHIYTSFPEGKIMQKEITIGGKTAKELAKEIKEKGGIIDDYAEEELLGNKDFKPLKKTKKLDLVILSVKDLGFPNGANIQEIYKKAQKLGLKLVPAEVGPQLRLQYEDQPMDEQLQIGMKPITVSDNFYGVFYLVRDDDGLWLDKEHGSPRTHWDSISRWVFTRK